VEIMAGRIFQLLLSGYELKSTSVVNHGPITLNPVSLTKTRRYVNVTGTGSICFIFHEWAHDGIQ
jgi:hypothetical protein